MTMMISTAMEKKLNSQAAAEFAASHEYLAMACAFEGMGLKIMGRRFFAQAEEEREHALKLVKYVQEVGGSAELGAIPKPSGDHSTPMKILKAALSAELRVTKQVNALMALAEKENDYATRGFLQWFVDEQVEEVSSISELVQLAQMAKDMLQVEARVRHNMAAK